MNKRTLANSFKYIQLQRKQNIQHTFMYVEMQKCLYCKEQRKNCNKINEIFFKADNK